MRTTELVKYYSQEGFINQFLEFCNEREVVPKFRDKFGSRPQVFNYRDEVLQTIRRGATSFHFSEERWVNPMRLSTGLKQKELDELRTGWDLVLDIDCDNFQYSSVCAKLLVDALDLHDVKASVKFSGNTGWHIGVPFESFPQKINNKPIKELFPEAARVISSYLSDLIKDYLKELIIEKDKSLDDKFNPYDVLSIDTVAIASRHLLRYPYSINEKSWLVSVPVKPSEIMSFKRENARPEKIIFEYKFLAKKSDATSLFIKAFDWFSKQEKKPEPQINYEQLKHSIESKYFPPCINSLINGLSDGRKRSLFILINFLSKTGYNWELIKQIISDWNNKNEEPLSNSYINAQLSWAKRHGARLPPNCDKQGFYTDIRVCKPDNFCKRIKNPVTYALNKSKVRRQKQPFSIKKK